MCIGFPSHRGTHCATCKLFTIVYNFYKCCISFLQFLSFVHVHTPQPNEHPKLEPNTMVHVDDDDDDSDNDDGDGGDDDDDDDDGDGGGDDDDNADYDDDVMHADAMTM